VTIEHTCRVLLRQKRCFMNLIPRRDDLFFPVESAFNKFFDDFFLNKSNLNTAKANIGYPKLNLYQTAGETKLVFSIPGLKSEDLTLEYGPGNCVTISGRMNNVYKGSDDSVYYYREIRGSSFERVVPLPENIEGEPDSATLQDGLLTLTWKNKASPQQLAKKIQIKSL